MTLLETVPVYNRKGRRMTSLKIEDFNAIQEFDDSFFEVTGDFVLVKNKFFKTDHLIKPYTLWIKGTNISNTPEPGNLYERVLFLLDAPRKNEFDYSNDFSGGLPLSVRSFANVQKTFHRLMKYINPQGRGSYEVTFYTMVPFQTTLHYLLGKSSNDITRFNFWFYGWNVLKYQKVFQEFIKKTPYDFYFNASTRAFKSYISNELSNYVKIEYQVHHPSSRLWKQKELNLGVKQIVHLNDKDIFG